LLFLVFSLPFFFCFSLQGVAAVPSRKKQKKKGREKTKKSNHPYCSKQQKGNHMQGTTKENRERKNTDKQSSLLL